MYANRLFKLNTAAILTAVFLVFSVITSQVQAQQNIFSGRNRDSYTCANTRFPAASPSYDNTLQKFVCCGSPSTTGAVSCTDALPLPPDLRQAEVWFVSILYLLWGLSGIFFTSVLIFIGFTYMTSQGDADKIAKAKERIRNWGIGFVLVFLAYPILSTAFSYIGINRCLSQDIQMPGFQFFFPQPFDATKCS